MGPGNSPENERLVFCVGSNILATVCKTNLLVELVPALPAVFCNVRDED